jgi:hypothetical protein
VASVGDDSANIGVRNRTVAFIFFFVEVKIQSAPLMWIIIRFYNIVHHVKNTLRCPSAGVAEWRSMI